MNSRRHQRYQLCIKLNAVAASLFLDRYLVCERATKIDSALISQCTQCIRQYMNLSLVHFSCCCRLFRHRTSLKANEHDDQYCVWSGEEFRKSNYATNARQIWTAADRARETDLTLTQTSIVLVGLSNKNPNEMYAVMTADSTNKFYHRIASSFCWCVSIFILFHTMLFNSIDLFW